MFVCMLNIRVYCFSSHRKVSNYIYDTYMYSHTSVQTVIPAVVLNK